MDFKFESFQDVSAHFFKRNSTPLLRSTLDSNALKNEIKQAHNPREQRLGLKMCGLWEEADLSYVQAMCHHSEPQIASSAAYALLCLCCKSMPPVLSPLLLPDLPDLCHYSILQTLGEWLDIRYAEPIPLPNHTLLLQQMAPYFEWLLKQGSLSRKIQTTMLLCRSDQRQFLPQIASLLKLDVRIPFMDWDDLFWVRDMNPAKASRTEHLRSALVGWLNTLDAKSAQAYLKPWLASLEWEAFWDWYSLARSLPELYQPKDLIPVLNHASPLYRLAGADILDRLEKSQELPQSMTEAQWLKYLPSKDLPLEWEEQNLLFKILEGRFGEGMLTPTLSQTLQNYNHYPWLQTFGQMVCETNTESHTQKNQQIKTQTLIDSETNLNIAQSRTINQWLDGLCQCENEELAYQAARSLELLDAHSCLPQVLEFLKLATANTLSDLDEKVSCGPQLSVFAQLGDASWVPQLLTLLTEQSLNSSDAHFLAKYILSPWLETGHGPQLWKAFCSISDPVKQKTFLELLCKVADRSWFSTLLPLLDEPHSAWVWEVSEWLEKWVRPEDFAQLKPYLWPEHPAFNCTYTLMKQIISEEVKAHVQLILEKYLLRDQIFLLALLWQ